ncbi:hypothetical protein M3Y94_00993800 [Aphelenchoides besseyi]|nr:hypothetical protein M3Y94_00993800 [Aphelenchoides besseyi]KAI6221180.1 hypothetical protein M3Y95_01013300 [Aphelenchoides besseyi]
MADCKLVVLFASIFLFTCIWSMSANFSQDNGNLDDYQICTPTGELEKIRGNVWHEKKKCHWNPNVTKTTIEFIEKWGRWPLTIAFTIYAPVFLTTVLISYLAICCTHDCQYLHLLVPSHGRRTAMFRVWWKVEIFAFVPLFCVTAYPAYVTQDVVDAYMRYSITYNFHHLACLFIQNGMLLAIEACHKDDHVKSKALDDTTNGSVTQTISKRRHLNDKVS